MIGECAALRFSFPKWRDHERRGLQIDEDPRTDGVPVDPTLGAGVRFNRGDYILSSA